MYVLIFYCLVLSSHYLWTVVDLIIDVLQTVVSSFYEAVTYMYLENCILHKLTKENNVKTVDVFMSCQRVVKCCL